MSLRFACVAGALALSSCGPSAASKEQGGQEPAGPVPGGTNPGSMRPIPRGISTLCGDGAWCFVHPYPTGTRLRDVWSTADSDVWFGGQSGTLLRFDGNTWTGEIGLSMRELVGFAGTGPDDVWAIDAPYRVVHWDGKTWSAVELSGARRPGQLSVRARDDVWLRRGAYDDGSELLHFDGKSWTTIAGTPRFITSLQHRGPNEAWFGSDEGLFRVARGGAPERVGDLRKVRALWSGGGPLWALTDEEVLRGDGATMTLVAAIHFPQVLTGCGVDDVYVRGNPSPVYHWDGKALSAIALPFEPELMHCTKGGDLWILAGPRIARRRGETWWAPPGNATLSNSHGLGSMWGPAANDLYLTGGRNLFHFDGRTWSRTEEFSGSVASISGSSASDIWVSAPYEGTPGVLHREGAAWKRYDIPEASPIILVSAIGPKDVWAIESKIPARAHHWDGSSWAHHDLLGTYDARAIVARDSNDIWLGMAGGLLHYTGGAWTKVPLPDPFPGFVEALADTDQGPLLAYGSATTPARIVRMQSGAFTTLFMGMNNAWIMGLSAEPNGDIWAVGSGIHWFHDGAWTRTASLDLNTRLYSKREGDLWAFGSSNGPIVLRRLAPGLQ